MRLLNSPGIIVSDSIVSSSQKKPFLGTMFLSESSNKLCDKLKLPLQEKQARYKSKIIDEEVVSIADKLLESKCMSLRNSIDYY